MKFFALVTAILAGLFVICSCGGSGGGTFNGPQGTVVFESAPENGGPVQIFVMSTSGQNRSQLTFYTDRPAHNPAISHDGRKVLFTTEAGNHVPQVFEMNIDGSDVSQLTFGQDGDMASFSPDDSRIAYVSGGNVHLMNSDGSNDLLLTAGQGSEYTPSFSPDGSQIVFSDNGNIAVISINGDGYFLLTNSQDEDYSPSWSADGTKIAFQRQHGLVRGIYLMDANGNNASELDANNAGCSHPSFTTDGSRIYYSSNESGEGDIYSIDVTGSHKQRITSYTHYDGNPSCGP